MDRRAFLARAGLLATWAAIPVTLTGCGDDDDGNPMDGGSGDVSGSVSNTGGHTHSVTITKAQIDAANSVVLTLTTSAGHTHTVSLTAEQVGTIGEGGQVQRESSSDQAHTHTVTFN
jgi:hypothetical protein